jgi:hypothetical protein
LIDEVNRGIERSTRDWRRADKMQELAQVWKRLREEGKDTQYL